MELVFIAGMAVIKRLHFIYINPQNIFFGPSN